MISQQERCQGNDGTRRRGSGIAIHGEKEKERQGYTKVSMSAPKYKGKQRNAKLGV